MPIKDVETNTKQGDESTEQKQWAEISSLTTKEVTDSFRSQFDRVDSNDNEYVTSDEIDAFLSTNENVLSSKQKQALKFFSKYADLIQTSSNDEWFTENGGMTKDDLTDWSKAAMKNFELEDWVMWAASRLRFSNGVNSETAARDFLEFAATVEPEKRVRMINRLENLAVHHYNNEPDYYWENGNFIHYADLISVAFGKNNEIRDATLQVNFGCQSNYCGDANRRYIDVYDSK